MPVPNNYITLADVKAYMPNNDVSTTNKWDTMITTLCTDMSRVFDSLTWRKPGAYFVSSDVTRDLNGVPLTATDMIDTILIDELAQAPTSVSISVSGSQSGFTPITSTDYFLEPNSAADEGKPYTQIKLNKVDGAIKCWPHFPHSIRVIGRFGYSVAVPADIFQAMLLLAVHMIRKAQQNYLEVGEIINYGQVMVGMKVDKDVSNLIAHYKKTRA